MRAIRTSPSWTPGSAAPLRKREQPGRAGHRDRGRGEHGADRGPAALNRVRPQIGRAERRRHERAAPDPNDGRNTRGLAALDANGGASASGRAALNTGTDRSLALASCTCPRSLQALAAPDACGGPRAQGAVARGARGRQGARRSRAPQALAAGLWALPSGLPEAAGLSGTERASAGSACGEALERVAVRRQHLSFRSPLPYFHNGFSRTSRT